MVILLALEAERQCYRMLCSVFELMLSALHPTYLSHDSLFAPCYHVVGVYPGSRSTGKNAG